jgi:hypothetical protein
MTKLRMYMSGLIKYLVSNLRVRETIIESQNNHHSYVTFTNNNFLFRYGIVQSRCNDTA